MKKNIYCILFLFTLIFTLIFACKSSPEIASTEESYTASGLFVRIPERVREADAQAAASGTVAGTATGQTSAARSETQTRGRIVIYTSMYEEVFRDIERAMERHFPGLDVIFVYGGTGQIQARIEAEIRNGRLGCDIIMTAEPSYSIELKEKGLLHPFISREARNLAFEYDIEGYWYPVRLSNMVIAYNPAKFSRDHVPGSYYEFGYSPDLRGSLSMGDPNTSGTTLVTINALWDRYMGQRYFEYLGAQRVQIDSYANALQKLETGQIKAAMVLEETVLRRRQINNSTIEVIYPEDGAVVVPSTIVIINDKWNANQNTTSATGIAEWFLSEEGQNIIVSTGWMHSVRRNFTRYPAGSKPTAQITANSYPVNWENIYRRKAEILQNFQRYVRRR